MRHSKAKSVGFTTKKTAVAVVTPPQSSEYNIIQPEQRLSEDHPEIERAVDLVAKICLACLDEADRNFTR